MSIEAGRNKEPDMPTSAKAATLQTLFKETIERRDAAVLLGFPRLAYKMELYRQRFNPVIKHPGGEPSIRPAVSFTRFETN